MRVHGFERPCLVTGHIGLYERCGWKCLRDVKEDDGGAIRMYGSPIARDERQRKQDNVQGGVLIEEVDERQVAAHMDDLVALWRASIEATHSFLASDDIERIEGYVPQAIQSVEHLVIAKDAAGLLLGFVGIDGEVIEMLFLDPQARGRGMGARLLRFASDSYGASKLDVNEQNEQARGFYEHMGFEVVGRSEADAMGEPFPILHMQLPKKR